MKDVMQHFAIFKVKNGLYGVMNNVGEVVVQPQYSHIDLLKDGYFKVSIPGENRYGQETKIINQIGETCFEIDNEYISFPFDYSEVKVVGNRFFAVKRDERWGVVNQLNEIIVPIEYSNISKIENGVISAFQISSTRRLMQTMFDTSGNILFHPMDTEGWFFAAVPNGFICSRNQNNWCLYNKNIELKNHWPKYNKIEFLAPGLYKVLVMEHIGPTMIERWGVINSNGEEITGIEYRDVVLKNNLIYLAPFHNERYSVLSTTGRIIVNSRYYSIDSFVDGTAIVGEYEGYGVVNELFEEIIPCRYRCIKRTGGGLFEADCQIINKKGLIVFNNGHKTLTLPSNKYYSASIFTNNLIKVYTKSGYGLIREDLSIALPPIFSELIPIDQHFFKFKKYDNWGVMNQKGQIVLPCHYLSINTKKQEDESEQKKNYVVFKRNSPVYARGLVSCNFDILMEAENDIQFREIDNIIVFRKNRQWGLYKPASNTFVPLPDYTWVGAPKEGMIRVCIGGEPQLETGYYEDGTSSTYYTSPKEGKWGFINYEGKLEIDCQYEKVYLFSEGMAAVKKDGRWGFVNKQGSFVIAPQYGYVESFQYGTATCYHDSDGYGDYVIVDMNGNIQDNGTVSKPQPDTYYDDGLSEAERWGADFVGDVLDGDPSNYWNID